MKASRKYEAGQVFGWLTLRASRRIMPIPGSTGERWYAECRCGKWHDVSRESLTNGRVRACRRCAKAYRASEDERMMR